MTELQVERRNVGNHRGLRLERFAELAYLALDFTRCRADRCERHRARFRHGPDKARVASEVERQHGLALGQRRLDLVDARRLWIDQISIGWEALVDLSAGLFPVRTQFLYRGVDGLDALFVPLSGRQSEDVVEQAELRAHLLA